MAPVTAMPVRELGSAGSATAGSWWAAPGEEETPELRWPACLAVYDRMRRQDAQVRSVLRAVSLPVQSTAWRVDPAGARDDVVRLIADDLGLPVKGEAAAPPAPRTRDRFSWDEHLQLVMLMLPFGHMFFEQVYRIDEQGRARLRKLAPRLPRTIAKVNVAADGGLVSVEQFSSTLNPGSTLGLGGPTVNLSANRLVAYVFEREGGNWLGTSLLRPAYKNWLLKDRLLRVQTQTIERNGMGVPVYEAAEGETDLTAGHDLARGVRAGNTAGGAVAYGAHLRMLGVEGTLPDANAAIRYHDEQIARAVLAHFLNLGTQTGSWALGSTFADFFTQSLQSVAQLIAQTASQHVVEDLVDVNFGPQEPAPRIVFDPIGSRQQSTAIALKALLDSGVLSADPTLEEAVRQQYGLPPRDPDAPRPAPETAPSSAVPDPPTGEQP